MLHSTAAGSIKSAVLIALGAASVWSASALAQDALQEIVVSAQRREQNLQDVGVAVSALSGDALRELGVAGSKDIANTIPGITFDGTAGGNQSVSLGIRGVVQSDYSVNQEAPNSLYLDEIYVSSPGELSFPIYDLDRVEVLRGPQGTLFGRASSGGLATFVTRRPTDETEGYAEVSYGRFNAWAVEAAVGGSLSDRVRGRVSTRVEKADGWYRNKLAGASDTFEEDFYGIRGQLEIDVTDSLVARLVMNYDRMPKHHEGIYKVISSYGLPNGDSATLPADLENPNFPGVGPGNDAFGYRDPYSDKQTGAFNDEGFFKMNRLSPSLYLTWTTEAFTLSSITNYTKFKSRYLEDCDGSPLDACKYPLNQDLKQWSQELRLNGTADALTWTTGAYFLKIDTDFYQGFDQPAFVGTDFGFSSDNPGTQKLTSYAMFGQLEFMFTDKLRGTVGVRYTHDRKTFDSQTLFRELGPALGGDGLYDPPLLVYDFRKGTVGALAKATDNLFSGKIQLDYVASDDMLFYAGVSRGVKGSGFNSNNSAAVSIDQTPFGDESVMAYEVGAKLTGLDRRLRVNTAAFYYDYKDFQAFQYVGLSGLVTNNDAKFSGFEVEVTAVPAEGLDLSVGVSHLFDATVKNVGTARRGIRDQDASNAAKWSATGVARFSHALGVGRVTIQWDGNFTDDRYASADNTGGNFIKGSFVHNARLSYALPDSGWDIAVYVKNLSDTERQNFVFDFSQATGQQLRSYAPPRQWGVSVRKQF